MSIDKMTTIKVDSKNLKAIRVLRAVEDRKSANEVVSILLDAYEKSKVK